MIALQTRIFIPWTDQYSMEAWVETVAGRIIQPLIQNHQVSWFWFSRYVQQYAESNVDTDLSEVPAGYKDPNGHGYRSVRLRLWLEGQDEAAVESDLRLLVTEARCWIHDLRHYDDLQDLASDRFCGLPYTTQRREQRRDLMREFLSSSAKLFLHMLDGPDSSGAFKLENNLNILQNPEAATFQSIHHLFCNMTDVPLTAQIQIGSHIYPPQRSGVVYAMKIRF